MWLEESSSPGQAVAQVASGEQFLIVASVKNVGTATASGFYLDVYYDSDYGRGGPDTIAPGEVQVWYVGSLTAQAGVHTTKWIVDPDNQIVELNESDNEKDYTFTIGSQTTTTTATTTTTSNSTVTSTTQTTTTTTSSTSTTLSPAAVSITVTANPSGSIVVDGTTYTSPQTFTWIPGSSHTIAANSPVSSAPGTQYVWTSWADGGDQLRTITTPSSPTTYTANYQIQYQVTYSQTGCSLPVSMPTTEWVNAGGSAVVVFPSTVISDDGKAQCLLQNASPSGPINAPTALAATYKTQYYLTVTSSYGNPTGQGWYDAGSTATFAVTSPASGGAGTQYAFTGWASSGTGGYTGADASHSFTLNSPITETASWKTQWEVTFAVNPSGGGAITVSSQSSVTTWYDDDAVINIQASPNTGYAYSSWSSDTASIVFTDSSASTTVTIHGTGTITANFLLADTTAPVITPAVTPTANSNGWNNGPVTVSWSVSDPESGIASSDGCATTTLNNETPLEGTTLTCTVTNGAGLSNSASVTVKIDLTAPTLTLPSPTVEATGPSGATVPYDASASDSLSGLDTFSCTPPSGSTFPIAATAVSCSATDKAGNAATSIFTVTVLSVQDKTAPVVTVPADITVDATGPTGAVVTFTASASDAVDGSLAPTCTPSSGSMFALGSTKVTCSVADKAGNTGSASFNVTVVDKTPPTLKIPADMTVQATSPGAVVTFSASASDLVDGSVPVTCTPASGSTFPVGTTTVACSATDKAGNPASASFKVTVTSTSTVAVTVKLLSSNGNGLSGGVVQCYSGGWKSFGTTGSDGTVSMALTPGTYTFQISYAGASQQKNQNVASNPNVTFQTTLVTVKLLASNGSAELAGTAQYYAGGWKTFGVSTTTVAMELLPLTYTFKISYAGASLQKSQNVGTNPTVVFQTTLVTMKLLSSTGQELGGGAQYYAGGWKTFGGGTTTTTMELLPLTYSFKVTYAGSSQQKSQNVASNPNVVFQTTLVTVKLLSSTGGGLSGGVQYYAGGWKTFGGGTTTASMELLPLTYTFRVSYAGASQQISQNIATNPNVIFKTVQVHSDSGKCTSYYAGGWRTFTQDMQLLPGAYTFRFNDGTKDISYTLVVGAIKHIH
jgi:hypothetical protein